MDKPKTRTPSDIVGWLSSVGHQDLSKLALSSGMTQVSKSIVAVEPREKSPDADKARQISKSLPR